MEAKLFNPIVCDPTKGTFKIKDLTLVGFLAGALAFMATRAIF